ncbi:hypothetical protein B0T10DRAFT_610178 [Thelonectria olida]|uniref:Uncharacterized protein n=1 Tax=Thelonectria olida TaxID=1576542 RepID=A0A9P9AKB0_9HYPO|nr:hypothetical protein B0T10DRAFT_610178 [Thelonectria olida]
MHFSSIILPLLPLVLADCWSGGQSFNVYKDYIKGRIRSDLCPGVAYFPPDEWKVYCVSVPRDINNSKGVVAFHVNFGAKSLREARSLAPKDCYNYFAREIDGCDYGGHSEYANWIFSVDPNAGPC